MRTLVLLALLALTAFASFSIDLEAQKINDDQFVTYSQGTGQEQKPVSAAAPSQKDADRVYTFSPKFEGLEGENRVVFDTTVARNWQFDSVATPKSTGSSKIEAANGRAELIKANEAKYNVELDGHSLKDVSVLKSNQQGTKNNKNIFNAATTGFALDRNSATNFFHNLDQNDVKIEQGGRGFFFHLSEKVNQIFFGLPNTFFATESLEKINAKNTVDNNRWTIPVAKKGISLNGLDPLSYKDPVYATFDSTTRYIWAGDDLVNQIVKALNAKGFNCADADQTHPIGLYNCESGEFPELQFQFNTNDSKFGEATRTYKLKNYTTPIGNNQVRLLVRKAAQYVNSTTPQKVPSTKLNAATQDVVLGTVFFENVFTYFSTDDHSVSLAQSYQVNPEPLAIDNTWRYWLLAAGAIATLAALGIVLSQMTKVPFNKEQAASLPAASTSAVAPQQQSYVYTSQAPVYQTYSYVQQQPVQLSPTRIVQTNLPQSYVQSQAPQQF